MTDQGIPEDVARLLSTDIATADELAVLVLMSRHPGRAWDVVTLAKDAALAWERAQDAVSQLTSQGVLSREGGSVALVDRGTGRRMTLERLRRLYDEDATPLLVELSRNALDRVRRHASRRLPEGEAAEP